jgi:hypothetical protein
MKKIGTVIKIYFEGWIGTFIHGTFHHWVYPIYGIQD